MFADVDEEFIDKMADIVQWHLRVSSARVDTNQWRHREQIVRRGDWFLYSANKLNGFVSELLHRSYDVPCGPMCKAL